MNPDKIKSLIKELEGLYETLKAKEHSLKDPIEQVHPEYLKSAANLIHYRALRSIDIRSLQKKLGNLGLSRLAKAERHILFSIRTNQLLLSRLMDMPGPKISRNVLTIKQSRKLSKQHATHLLGPPVNGRKSGVMVTIPTEGSTDPGLIYNMVKRGMSIARINCAHDGPEVWSNVIKNIRTASDQLDRKVKIAMDLSGPKIRTAHKEMFTVQAGDTILLAKSHLKTIQLPYVICSIPEVLDRLEVNHPVLFDDGKIVTRVTRIETQMAHLVVERTSGEVSKLKPEKGINLPSTDVKISGLTPKDKTDLEFVVRHADFVNYSFVNSYMDVEELITTLDQLNVPDHFGIVLKIETKKAYDNLVSILLAAMKRFPVGVMIARGDLTIETGWKSMGRIQEELITLCNAAHIPVIWATQVLENLAKKGIPSRSEMTDATASIRADCVMLNKGPYILEAIDLLNEVLLEEQEYHEKNAPLLPELRSFAQEPTKKAKG